MTLTELWAPVQNHGATGATAQGRWVGTTASGAPASGTFQVGDWVTTQDGHVFVCTVAGTPGTWANAGASGISLIDSPGGSIGVTNPSGPTASLAVANSGVSAGTYGDSSNVGQFTVGADGRLTGASSVSITGSGGVAAADGWIDDSAETWTYASGSGGGTATFTIAGIDLTAKYSPGTRIKLTQTTVKYFVVASSTFGGGNTTVTITAGTDYTLANAAISANFHSYMGNPQGYPGWFNFAPAPTGFTGAVTVNYARFNVNGRMVTVATRFTGTSNATTCTCTAPITSANNSQNGAGPYKATNSGTDDGTPGRAVILGNSATITFTRNWGATAWTNSGTKTVDFCIVTYEI